MGRTRKKPARTEARKAAPQKISYRSWVAPDFVEEVSTQIVRKLMIEKKYRDPNYSAQRLSDELGINPRQLSAVVGMRFQQNYSKLVNDMRVHEAMYMLQDSHFEDMKMEDVAVTVGFSTRQSFYTEFNRLSGMTPREYRILHSRATGVAEGES